MSHPRSHPAFRKRGTLSQAKYDELVRGYDKQCDCQNPEAGYVSAGCYQHNDLSEAELRTQQWLRELELD